MREEGSEEERQIWREGERKRRGMQGRGREKERRGREKERRGRGIYTCFSFILAILTSNEVLL